MKVTTKDLSPTVIKIIVSLQESDLSISKTHTLQHMAQAVSVPGFRKGKVPPAIAEKHLDQNKLQAEVLYDAVNRYFIQATDEIDARIVGEPKIEVVKYVPFTLLEFEAEIEKIGMVSLPKYKQIKLGKKRASINESDVDEVIERMRLQFAKYNEVERKSKVGDRVWIDFDGRDEKGVAIPGASGKDYPLSLGSNTFIPGFEDNIIGLKKDDNKNFKITFPKDYSLKSLQGKLVEFVIKVNKVESTELPKIDNKLAKQIGPFGSIEDLREDIKSQLKHEQQHKIDREFEEELIKTIVDKSKVDIPAVLLEKQVEALNAELKNNLSYRKQSLSEYLELNGLSEEELRNKELLPAAEMRIKTGIVLSEISKLEGVRVSDQEIDIRLQILKNQYKDEQMQSELSKPEARNEIHSRLLTEKTINLLTEYSTK